jgi:hypothetical protein
MEWYSVWGDFVAQVEGRGVTVNRASVEGSVGTA